MKHFVPGEDSPRNTEVSQTLHSLMYDARSFAEAALRARNTDGGLLAVRSLTDHARLAAEAHHEEQLAYTIRALLGVGVLAASLADQLPQSSLPLQGSVADRAKDALARYGIPETIAKEAQEILMGYSSEVDHDVASAYVDQVLRALRETTRSAETQLRHSRNW